MVEERALPQDWEIVFQRPEWLQETQGLYRSVYGEQYTLTEIMDPEESKKTITSETSWWWVARSKDRVVASVLFSLEKEHRLGKAYGGVVDPSCRGVGLMQNMVLLGVNFLLRENMLADAVYSVVRTFVSLQFHKDLEKIGFLDMGVFPNVRKVKQYETHGLKLCVTDRYLAERKREPYLTEEVVTLYSIVRGRLDLEPAKVLPGIAPIKDFSSIELTPEWNMNAPENVVEGYEKSQKNLLCSFFPLHQPNVLLKNADLGCEVYVSYQVRDGHSSILGIEPGKADFADLLYSVGQVLEDLGTVYLELLLSAYKPEVQREAISAGFLPCAYFLGGKINERGEREDVLVTSKTFVPLHFRRLKISDTVKPFLLEYFKLYSSRIWEDLIDA